MRSLFVLILFSCNAAFATSNCPDLSGTYECNIGGQLLISQKLVGQFTHFEVEHDGHKYKVIADGLARSMPYNFSFDLSKFVCAGRGSKINLVEYVENARVIHDVSIYQKLSNGDLQEVQVDLISDHPSSRFGKYCRKISKPR